VGRTLKIQSLLQPLFPEIDRPLRAEDSPATLWPWDSVRQVDIVLTVEETFDIALSTAEIAALTSVGALFEVLRRRGLEVEI
jgi:acyl carrier protein